MINDDMVIWLKTVCGSNKVFYRGKRYRLSRLLKMANGELSIDESDLFKVL